VADTIGSAASTRRIVFRTPAITGAVSVAVRIRNVGLFAEEPRSLVVTK
jgi:hypothetical protein